MGTTAYGGKGSKGRAANGDRPVGAASCRRDHHTMASCQNPPAELPIARGGGGGGRARSLYANPPSPPPPHILSGAGAMAPTTPNFLSHA